MAASCAAKSSISWLIRAGTYRKSPGRARHHLGHAFGAPGIEEVLPRLARFVEDTVIVGHNIAFDLRFFARKEEEAESASQIRCSIRFF